MGDFPPACQAGGGFLGVVVSHGMEVFWLINPLWGKTGRKRKIQKNIWMMKIFLG